MTINVQSYPELYTMLMGWSLYDKLWILLTQTGIAYLPFIGMILKNISKSYTMHGNHGTSSSLRSMEVNFITMLLLIFFGVAPCIPLDVHTVSYSPICGVDKDKTCYPGSTRTTYDNAFNIPDGEIRVPIWWYAVISVSEGITSAANNMMGCIPNLRKMVTQVSMAKITDPELKEEIQDFETMCYIPARTEFLNRDKMQKTEFQDRIQDDVKKYGVSDTEWLGSHAFGEVYYHRLKATRPVIGFPYESDEDLNADVSKSSSPQYGTPTCYDWWNNIEFGLKNRILASSLPDTFKSEFKDYINTDVERDEVAKTIISDAPNYANANQMIGDQSYSHLTSAIGIWYHQLDTYPKIYAAGQAAPIIQSLLLLMIYVFLPFALVFSSYRASTFITGGILIFSLIFWSFIWHLVSWTDKSLMQALYEGWFAKQGAGATLTDMIIGTLVIVAPLFWFMFMGAMGVAAGDIVGNIVLGLNKIGDGAAASGASQVKQVAKTTATML